MRRCANGASRRSSSTRSARTRSRRCSRRGWSAPTACSAPTTIRTCGSRSRCCATRRRSGRCRATKCTRRTCGNGADPAHPAAAAGERRPVSCFADRLQRAQPTARGTRRWLFVPYDQLHDGIGPLAHEPPGELGIVLVESRAKAARRPYHRHKLALVLTNLRHFALEQAARGVAVRHVATDGGYYYELPGGGGDEALGYVQVGLMLSLALADLPHPGTPWTLDIGLSYLVLGDSNRARNGGDRDELLAVLAIATSF
ncbi:MAG: cryptochrome/photolyase family protein [Planctomycetes bacterium]|nr:cryptochrome/photolyase family protein [Planctomycetota bacterium]